MVESCLPRLFLTSINPDLGVLVLRSSRTSDLCVLLMSSKQRKRLACLRSVSRNTPEDKPAQRETDIMFPLQSRSEVPGVQDMFTCFTIPASMKMMEEVRSALGKQRRLVLWDVSNLYRETYSLPERTNVSSSCSMSSTVFWLHLHLRHLAFITSDLHWLIHTFTHRQRSQPCKATASTSGAVRLRRLTQGHLDTLARRSRGSN